MRLICALVVVCLYCSFTLGDNSNNDDEFNTLLKIARDYRYGKDGTVISHLRAARFYELVIERAESIASLDDVTYQRTVEAEYELMEILEIDPTLSKKHSYLGLNIRAADGGHAEAQHKLSVAYATGIAARDLTPMDAGRSLFLEYMSALSGHVLGNMGMGYRYLNGIGVIESCEAALPHYEFAANYAAEYVQQHGGHVQHPDTQKLSETMDPSSRWSKRDGTLELADYYAHLAEQGDTLAAVTLGNMLLVGTRHLEANETRALHYLNLAAEAQNPAGAGLQGYVLLQKFLQQVQEIANSNSIQAARDYASSFTGKVQTDRILKLLQFANRKGDVHGILGMGVSYFHGIGQRANLSRALDHMERTAGAHMDAGFYIGEICMGLQSFDLSGDSELSSRAKSRHRIATSGVITDGIAKGNTPAETRALENHVITHAMQQKDVDPGAATRAYTISAQLGHTLAQHRLAHLYKRGLSGPVTCKETAKLLKAVAERGPWMEDLAHAHRLYAEGSEQAALHLFAQLAAVGVESAQYNAAFILSRCTRCAPVGNQLTASTGRSVGLTSTLESVYTAESLERQHRSLKHSTATNFRALLQLHVEHNQHLQARSAEHVTKPSVVGETALFLQQGDPVYARKLTSQHMQTVGPGDVAYLNAAVWREFLQQYQPDSLSTELDLEFAADLNADAVLVRKERVEAARTCLYEARALTLFDLSAQQGNPEAFMQLGDFYYYQRAGLVQAERKREAAEFYQKAADLHHTQAIFNLGIMHEVGDGVSQDFHLAKRYYDHAAEVDSKARVPRDIALLLLEGHKTFNALFGPDAVSEILSATVYIPVSWTELQLRPVTVWELIGEISRLDRQVRRYIDLAVVLYFEQVLQPMRNALDILSAPLHSVSGFNALSGGDGKSDSSGQKESEGSASTTHRDTATARTSGMVMEHSVRGSWKVLSSLPDTLRSLYDKAFEVGFLLLHYLIRGEARPTLSGQQDEEIMQLREELLLVVLMCFVFSLVLAVKLVRRRIHEELRQGPVGVLAQPPQAL